MAPPSFEYQYILSTTDFTHPPSFKVISKGGVKIAFDPRFQVLEICDSRSQQIALAIGFPYDEEKGDFPQSGKLTLPSEPINTATFESSVLPRFSGSYFALTFGPLPVRLYLDPAGSLPVAFMPERQLAAATPALILNNEEYAARFDHDLHRAAVKDEGVGGWISGDLTAHSGVNRLLPNHFLDLEHWTAHRHWPKPDDFREWMPFSKAVEQASAALSRFTSAVTRQFPTALTLTAGFDSRLLLASAREVIPQCEFATFNHPTAKLDVDVARALAQRFALPHHVEQVLEADDFQRASWDRAVGDCVIEGNRTSHPTLKTLRANVVLTGMYGEIGRCRLYRQDLDIINESKIDSSFIVSRLTLPHHQKLGEAIEKWFEGVRSLPNSVILDLAFLELKFGSWAMGQHPIQNTYKFHLLPYAQRQVLEAFIGVNPIEKTTDRLFTACIMKLWPDLMIFPINKYGDYRDHLVTLNKITRPSRVKRFLRDRLAKKNSDQS